MRSGYLFTVLLAALLVCNGFFIFSIRDGKDQLTGIVRSGGNGAPQENVATRFAGGDGSEGNPYRISNVTQLQDMNLNLSAHYVLINDIDASDTVNWNGGDGFESIAMDDEIFSGFQGEKFTGSLNGAGHNIIGIFIDRSDTEYIGLIGAIGTGGLVSNITLIDVNVTGDDYTGGIAGISYGAIIDTSIRGDIHGRWSTGGLVGKNENNRMISNCHSTGNVEGVRDVGGLVGRNQGIIHFSYSNCIVSGDVCIGGLVGDNGRKVNSSYSTGDVTSNWAVGGLIGSTSTVSDYLDVTNSYFSINESAINGEHYISPFGIYEDQFDDWLNNNRILNIDNYLSKIPGKEDYRVADLSDFRSMLPFLNKGPYSFTQCSDIDLTSEPGLHLPYFTGKYDGNGHTICDLNLTARPMSRIGLFGVNFGSIFNLSVLNARISQAETQGVLVGYNMGMISDCTITGIVCGVDSNKCGLLAGISDGGIIENCCVVGTVSGHDCIGGLVGYSNDNHGIPIIKNCSASCNVTGNGWIGGFIGKSYNTTVKESYASGVTEGRWGVGGLVGENEHGAVTNTYATGTVKGEMVGGLIGNLRDATVSNSYSTCNVISTGQYVGGLVGSGYYGGIVEDSFWNTQTSNCPTSDGGTGKTSVEMLKRNIYTDSGWNFNTVWRIIEGYTYPFLRNVTYPLEITSSRIPDAYENQYFSVPIIVKSSIPGNPAIAYRFEFTTDADRWMSISNLGILHGTPTDNDTGTYWVNITVSIDDFCHTFRNFSFRIITENNPPVILTKTGDILCSIEEDTYYCFNFTAGDADITNDTLNWSFDTEANFLDLNSTTGSLSGTPGNWDVGIWYVVVTVSDGNGGHDSINYTLTVININDAPEIMTTPVTTCDEDEPYSLDFYAVDIDLTFDTLHWSFGSNASFLYFDAYTVHLSGVPTNSDVGFWWINVTVDDGNNGMDSINYTLIVNNTNDAPEVNTSEMHITFDEDTVYQAILLNEVFRDIDGDDLYYSYDTSGNITIEILPNSAVLFTPIKDWCGTERITFYANDSKEEINVTVTIMVSPVNDAPTNASITLDNNTYYEGGQQPAYGNATDVDLPYGDRLLYEWTFNSTDNTLSGDEVNLSLPAGKHLVTLIVSDLKGASAEISMEITILAKSVPGDIETPVEPDENETGDEESSSSAMTYVGIGGAILVVVIITAVLVIFFLRKRPPKDKRKKEGLTDEATDGDGQSETAQETSLQEEGDIGNNMVSPPTPTPPVPSVNDPAPPPVDDLTVFAAVPPETPLPTATFTTPLPPPSPPSAPPPVEPQLPACFLCGQPGTYYPEYTAFWCETCQQWLQ